MNKPEKKSEYPMRINKYLAHKQFATRRGADELIEQGKVSINGKRAVLGDKVHAHDKVDVKSARRKSTYLYFAYNKIAPAKQLDDNDAEDLTNKPRFQQGVIPLITLGRNDHGLMIYTNDGRITDAATNPKTSPEKEYVVTTKNKIRDIFQANMEKGLDIDGYKTNPCRVAVIDDTTFVIALHEGKKHQVRRMCEVLHNEVASLKRTRIANIAIGNLPAGQFRPIIDEELDAFLETLGS